MLPFVAIFHTFQFGFHAYSYIKFSNMGRPLGKLITESYKDHFRAVGYVGGSYFSSIKRKEAECKTKLINRDDAKLHNLFHPFLVFTSKERTF